MADDAAARRRELIGRCAAKTAGLDGATAERYAGYVRDGLVLWRRPQASGTVLRLEKGIRLEFLRVLGPWFLLLLLFVVHALSFPESWVQTIAAAVFVLAIGSPLFIAQAWSWRTKVIGAWSAMLPQAGTAIRADSRHLTIGATPVPWDEVRLEAVEVQAVWPIPRFFPKYRVDQLRLGTSSGSVVLDARLIKNGRAVIDTICGNLV